MKHLRGIQEYTAALIRESRPDKRAFYARIISQHATQLQRLTTTENDSNV